MTVTSGKSICMFKFNQLIVFVEVYNVAIDSEIKRKGHNPTKVKVS